MCAYSPGQVTKIKYNNNTLELFNGGNRASQSLSDFLQIRDNFNVDFMSFFFYKCMLLAHKIDILFYLLIITFFT